MSTMEGVAAVELIETDRYPLWDPGSRAWQDVVSPTRAELGEVGCGILTDFVRAEVDEILESECARMAPSAYSRIELVNAYNMATGTLLPHGHPGHTIMERGNAFVARDQIPASSIIHQLYTSPAFQCFVADCFALPQVHELADPLSGLTLNVIAPGRSQPWHFDTN